MPWISRTLTGLGLGLLAACGPRMLAPPAVIAPAPNEAPPKESPPPPVTPAPGICSASGWCWYHPVPQGNRLDALVGTTSTEIWAIGLDTLLRFDGQRWERLAGIPEGLWFRQLAPRASGGFWALGQQWSTSGEQGVLYAWDGKQWQDSGLRTQPLQAMWVANDHDIWLTTADGVLSRWDGRTLRNVSSPTHEYTPALSGTSERDVWLAASDGLFHWDGQRWSRARSASKSLLVRGPGDVWSVDDDGVHHLEGTTWRSWPLAPDEKRRVFDGGDGSVWLADSQAISRFMGDAWQPTTSNEHRVDQLWAAPDGTAWALGDRAVLMRWDGARWAQKPEKALFAQLRAIWGAADDDIWAAGERLVTHFDGHTWTRVAAPEDAYIHALWGSGPDDVWGVGHGIVHWDGHAWSRTPVHRWGGLHAVWGTGPNDVWARGRHVVLHYDGCWWTIERAAPHMGRSNGEVVMPALPANSREPVLRYVQGPGAIYIVDEDAAVHRWDAATWHDEAQDLLRHSPNALWVSPGGDIWLTSNYGNGGILGKRAPARPGRLPPVVAPPPPRTCGPDPTAVALASAFTTADDASRRGAQPLDADTAREVARVWLEAMRDMQSLTLARTSALPLTVDGFQSCGASRVALDVEGFRDLLDCMLGDSLVRYVPRDRLDGWTGRGAPGHISGTLKVIRPAGLAKRLARHRATVEALALAGQELVQARMTDNNGVTNHALLAVQATPLGPRVTTVLYDMLFEE